MSTKMEVRLQSELTECLVNAKQWLLCMGENLIDQGYVSGPWEAPSLAGGTRPLQIVFSMWYVQFSSVTQSCPTLWNPMDCSMPDVAVLHQARSLGKLMSIELVIHPTVLSSVILFFSCLQSFPVTGSFLMSQLFTLVGQSIGGSISGLVLPMNIQDWFPLGWLGGSTCSPRDT